MLAKPVKKKALKTSQTLADMVKNNNEHSALTDFCMAAACVFAHIR